MVIDASHRANVSVVFGPSKSQEATIQRFGGKEYQILHLELVIHQKNHVLLRDTCQIPVVVGHDGSRNVDWFLKRSSRGVAASFDSVGHDRIGIKTTETNYSIARQVNGSPLYSSLTRYLKNEGICVTRHAVSVDRITKYPLDGKLSSLDRFVIDGVPTSNDEIIKLANEANEARLVLSEKGKIGASIKKARVRSMLFSMYGEKIIECERNIYATQYSMRTTVATMTGHFMNRTNPNSKELKRLFDDLEIYPWTTGPNAYRFVLTNAGYRVMDKIEKLIERYTSINKVSWTSSLYQLFDRLAEQVFDEIYLGHSSHLTESDDGVDLDRTNLSPIEQNQYTNIRNAVINHYAKSTMEILKEKANTLLEANVAQMENMAI